MQEIAVLSGPIPEDDLVKLAYILPVAVMFVGLLVCVGIALASSRRLKKRIEEEKKKDDSDDE